MFLRPVHRRVHSRLCECVMYLLGITCIILAFVVMFCTYCRRNQLHPSLKHHDKRQVLVHHINSEQELANVDVLVFLDVTVGGWTDDIVILSVNCMYGDNAECLFNIGAKVYNTEYTSPELAMLDALEHGIFDEYDIVQYVDVHSVIIGPIKQVQLEDFGRDKILLMDDVCGDVYRGRSVLSAFNSPLDMHDLSGMYPGCTEPENGNNHSPVGGLRTYAINTQHMFHYLRGDVLGQAKGLLNRYMSLTHRQAMMLVCWNHFKTMGRSYFDTACNVSSWDANIIWTEPANDFSIESSFFHEYYREVYLSMITGM